MNPVFTILLALASATFARDFRPEAYFEDIPAPNGSVLQCYVFKTLQGVGYQVQASNDLMSWSDVGEVYGLGHEYVVTLRESVAAPPPDPEAPPPPDPPGPPTKSASIRMQPATGTEGGTVIAWPSLDHGGPVIVKIAGSLDANWASVPLYVNGFGDYQFLVWHPSESVEPPVTNPPLGPEDAAMLAALEVNLPAMNAEVAASAARSRNAPPPAPSDPAALRFWRIKVDAGIDTDQDGSSDWAEFEIAGRGTGIQVAGVVGDPFDGDTNRDGIPDGEQLDADLDGTADAKDPDSAEDTTFVPIERLPRYAMFEIPGRAIQINDLGTVIFPTKVWRGGTLADLPGGGTARGINDLDVILGTEGRNEDDPDGTSQVIGKVCYWPNPTSPYRTLEVIENGQTVFAYCHHDTLIANGPGPILSSSGQFIEHGFVENPPPDYQYLYDSYPTLWQIPAGTATATRQASPLGSIYLNDPGLYWGSVNPFDPDKPEEIGSVRVPALLPPLPFIPWNVIPQTLPKGGTQYIATRNPADSPATGGTLVYSSGSWRPSAAYADAIDIALDGIAIGYSQDGRIGGIFLNGQWSSLSRTTPGIPAAWLENPGTSLRDTTAHGWVLARDEVNAKSAVMLPIRVEGHPADATLASDSTGVDAFSIGSTDGANSVRDRIWIMAPSIAGSTSITVKAPINGSTPLKLSAPGVNFDAATEKILTGPDTTFNIESMGSGTASGTDIPLQLHLGNQASLSTPLGVKVMKSRNIKVTLYKVTKETPNQPDNTADLTPTPAQLQAYLNAIFRPQINADFTVIEGTTLKLNWDTNGNGSMDATDRDEVGTEQQAILDKRPATRPISNIDVFLMGTDLDKKIHNNTAWGVTNRSENACWVVADTMENSSAPGSGRNIGNLVQTIAHEVGHVVTDYGHPDKKSGPAILPGTDHKERLMHSGLGLGDGTVGNTVWKAARGTRLVKAEWDAAEVWMKTEIDGEGNQ